MRKAFVVILVLVGIAMLAKLSGKCPCCAKRADSSETAEPVAADA